MQKSGVAACRRVPSTAVRPGGVNWLGRQRLTDNLADADSNGHPPGMSNAQFILRTPGTGKAYSAVGDRYIMLASGNDTGGAYCLLEATVPPGGGPPLHYHTRDEESFYVLEGEVTFTVNGRSVVGTAGTFVHLPRNVPHAFRNNAGHSARMLIQCAPAGFDRFMLEFAVELPSVDSPPIPPSDEEIRRLLEVAPRYGIFILPPPGNQPAIAEL